MKTKSRPDAIAMMLPALLILGLACCNTGCENPEESGAEAITPSPVTQTTFADTALLVSWQAPLQRGTMFEIERQVDGGGFLNVGSVDSTLSYLDVMPLHTGHVYIHRVRMIHDSKMSAYGTSDPLTFSLSGPANLAVDSITASQVTLRWENMTNFGKMILIEMSAGDPSAFVVVDSVAFPGTSKSVAGSYARGTIYYFRARFRSANNLSDPSSTVPAAIGILVADWVTVPAGPYTYGSAPSTQMMDHSFQIMKYPVTNAQYVAYLREALAGGEISVNTDPLNGHTVQGWYPGDSRTAAGRYVFYFLRSGIDAYKYGMIDYSGTFTSNGYADHPVVNVTWFGAYGFAQHYGFRLPTEEEWEDAARGNTGFVYPWGDSISAPDANYWDSGDPFDNGTTPVGYYNGQTHGTFVTQDRPSPYGAYDMVGNVGQWTASVYPDGTHIHRGGSWSYTTPDLQCWKQWGYGPSYIVGFRCAR